MPQRPMSSSQFPFQDLLVQGQGQGATGMAVSPLLSVQLLTSMECNRAERLPTIQLHPTPNSLPYTSVSGSVHLNLKPEVSQKLGDPLRHIAPSASCRARVPSPAHHTEQLQGLAEGEQDPELWKKTKPLRLLFLRHIGTSPCCS